MDKTEEQLSKEIWVNTNRAISNCLDINKSLELLAEKSEENFGLNKEAKTLSTYIDNILSDLDVVSVFSNIVGNKGSNPDGTIDWEQRIYDLYIKYLERYNHKDAIRRADEDIRIYKEAFDLF